MAGAPGTAQVICSLPLTAPAAGGSTVGSIAVNYYDRGASGFRVSCGFQAVDSQGNIAFSGALTSPSGGPGTGLQTFTWGPFGPAPFDPASYRLSVNCSIPPSNGGWTSHITGMQASVVLP